MPHLFLGRSQRLFLFFFLFLFFLKDTKSVHLNFQYILAALWRYTNVRAASRKVASLDWKRSCLISQSQLGPGWRQHKAGDWQQKVCSSRMERSRVKRETEWYEKKQKCSSHKTAGPHSYVHAGPLKQMLTPCFQCGVLLDCGQLLFPGHLRPYADHPHPTCPPKPPTHVQLHPHPPHPWKKGCISDRKPQVNWGLFQQGDATGTKSPGNLLSKSCNLSASGDKWFIHLNSSVLQSEQLLLLPQTCWRSLLSSADSGWINLTCNPRE